MDNVAVVESTDSCEDLPHHGPNLLLVDPRYSPLLFVNEFLDKRDSTSRSPPSANSITIHRELDLLSKKASLYLMM